MEKRNMPRRKKKHSKLKENKSIGDFVSWFRKNHPERQKPSNYDVDDAYLEYKERILKIQHPQIYDMLNRDYLENAKTREDSVDNSSWMKPHRILSRSVRLLLFYGPGPYWYSKHPEPKLHTYIADVLPYTKLEKLYI